MTQQEFDYDSEYYGFGFLGEALFGPRRMRSGGGIRNLLYFGEFIVRAWCLLRRGRKPDDQDPIRSCALTLLNLLSPGPLRTRFLANRPRLG